MILRLSFTSICGNLDTWDADNVVVSFCSIFFAQKYGKPQCVFYFSRFSRIFHEFPIFFFFHFRGPWWSLPSPGFFFFTRWRAPSRRSFQQRNLRMSCGKKTRQFSNNNSPTGPWRKKFRFKKKKKTYNGTCHYTPIVHKCHFFVQQNARKVPSG